MDACSSARALAAGRRSLPQPPAGAAPRGRAGRCARCAALRASYPTRSAALSLPQPAPHVPPFAAAASPASLRRAALRAPAPRRGLPCRALVPRAAAAAPPAAPAAPPAPPAPPEEPPQRGWSRTQLLAFVGTYAAYAGCYLARNNSAVAKAALGADLGFPQQTLGALDAAFLTAYTLGSFALGPLTDAVGAWPCLAVGLAGVGACQAGLAWGGATAAPPLAALYAANGLLQSALYPACKKVMAEHFGEKSRGAALGQWSTCYYAGSIASTALATQLLAGSGGGPGAWRVVFAAPAMLLPLLAAALLPVAAAMPPSPTHAELAPPAAAADGTAAGAAAPDAGGLLAAYPAPIWVCSLSYAVIKCTRYAFLLWLPLYLINDAGLSLASAGATAALFDAGSIGARRARIAARSAKRHARRAHAQRR
jgi:sugar phosphate permease